MVQSDGLCQCVGGDFDQRCDYAGDMAEIMAKGRQRQGEAEIMGQRPGSYQHGATPHVSAAKDISANGAIHLGRHPRCWMVGNWGMGRAFSPL